MSKPTALNRTIGVIAIAAMHLPAVNAGREPHRRGV